MKYFSLSLLTKHSSDCAANRGAIDVRIFLNVENLGWRVERTVPPTVLNMAAMRLPPRPSHLYFPAHNYDLAEALIEALGDLGYTDAADELFKLRGTEYDAEATRALSKLVPERLATESLATATDRQIDSYLRERALVTLCNISSTNHLREIVPLLDDVTPITYSRSMPGPEWRICDRAAGEHGLDAWVGARD